MWHYILQGIFSGGYGIMPIYEYECRKCGKHFEIFQRISDDPLKECKFCNGELTKLISQCAFHLKGSGWYVTDYRSPVDGARSKIGSGNGTAVEEKSQPSASEATVEASTASTGTTETKSETTNS